MRNQRIGIVALVWLLLLMAVTVANAQTIETNTTFMQSGRVINVKARNIDSVSSAWSPLIDVSHFDGQTVYMTGWAKSAGGAHDSLKVIMWGWHKMTSQGLSDVADSLTLLKVPLDTFYIPCRVSRDTIIAIQTPALTPTGYFPQVKLEMVSGSSGTNEATARDISFAMFCLYARVEDTVPPFRKLQNSPY